MDVREFVANTILQIVQGVADTQDQAQALKASVNPAIQNQAKGEQAAILGYTAAAQAIYLVEFDIAVTVGNELGAEGGGRLQVASLVNIGGKAKSTDKSESTSRVRFSVPIALPIEAQTTEERAERARKQTEAINRRNAAAAAGNRSQWG